MPTLREYRVVLPMNLEEFQRARLWHKIEQMKLELRLLQNNSVKVTEFGERTLLREETRSIPSFYSETSIKDATPAEHVIKGYGSGESSVGYTSMFASLSAFLDMFFSKSVKLTEVESWEAYPYFRSVSANSGLGSKYHMMIEGISIPGNVKEENPLNLPASILNEREVVLIDIASNVGVDDYEGGQDPILFRSQKTGRGPLEPGVWMQEVQPCVTCYVLVSIHFDFLGPVGRYAEMKLHGGVHRAMKLHHRELFCYIDEWIDFSSEVLEETVKKLQVELDETVELKLKNISDGITDKKPDEEGSSTEPLLAKDGEENAVRSSGCGGCSMEAIKSTLFSSCSASCGQVSCFSWISIGMTSCFFALIVAVVLQFTFV